LTNPWGYYRLVEHINTYKYFLSIEKKAEVSWEEALKSWYNEFYLPIIKLIKRKKILRFFPEREPGDLYIWIMDHWHFLKEQNLNVEIEEAIEDYSKRFGKKGIFKTFFNLFKKRKN